MADGHSESTTQRNLVVARRYVLMDRLGVGGMGEVWRAHDLVMQEPVAIKVLLASIAGATAAELRFQREIEAMSRLDHPGIVPVIDAGRDPNVGLYFVMTLQDGKPLHEEYRRWNAWAEMWPVIDKVLDALGHAHARGVIHRDIKPDNVLIDADGEPVLLDFGVARLKDQARSGTSAHDMLGTVDYAAPEQATGNRRRIGPWTDIYAFGIVLFELVCGRLPFVAPSAVQSLMIRLDHGCPPLDPRPGFATPRGLWNVLDAMMRPDVHERIQHISEVRERLSNLLLEPVERLNPVGGGGLGGEASVPRNSDELRWDTAPTHDADDEQDSLVSRRGSRFSVDADETSVRPLEPPLRPHALLGRDQLLMSLSRGLDRWQRDPQPGVLMIAGPSGIGKTRLCEELLVPFIASGQVESHRHVWLQGNEQEEPLRDLGLSLTTALGMDRSPMRDQVDWWLRGRGLSETERRPFIDWLVPDPEVSVHEPLPARARRAAQFLRICTLRSRPFALLIDGLEHLDRALLALVAAVRDARLPMVLLIATRDASSPPGADAPSWLAPATRILEPVDDDAVRTMTDAMVALGAEEREALVAAADGNPQRLVDALNGQRTRGLVVPAHPRWVKAPTWWRVGRPPA
ncbi:MAG: protein kinase domain-containing protein [Bradymonadia bacterium]